MKLLLVLLTVLGAGTALADPINNYSTTTPVCADFSKMLVVTAAKPNGQRYRLSVRLQEVGAPDLNTQAAALVPLLQTKFDNPLVPSSDSLPFKTWASPLGWFVLGKSVLGAGCGTPQ
jgi:hypothetical protein